MHTPEAGIRLAGATDTAAVRKLVCRAYAHYVARIGRKPAPMTVDYDHAIGESCVWVLDVEGRVGGVIVLRDRPDHVFIGNVAVEPDLQGSGVGSALLRFTEKRARSGATLELRLHTNEAMTDNIAFYSTRGFVEVDRVTEDGFARVLFVKRLSER